MSSKSSFLVSAVQGLADMLLENLREQREHRDGAIIVLVVFASLAPISRSNLDRFPH